MGYVHKLIESFGYHFARGYSLGARGPSAKQILGREAQLETSRFTATQLTDAFFANRREKIWQSGLDRTSGGGGVEDGLIIEFGVWEGKSLSWFAENVNLIVYGFDGFDGLQEDWAGVHPKGYFAVNSLPKVPANANLVVGPAQETLPKFLEDHQQSVRFVHFDMDTYQSTLDVLRLIRARLVPGSVIVFDEFLGFTMWQQGEYKAWCEFVAETQIRFKYFATTGVQVGVEIL